MTITTPEYDIQVANTAAFIAADPTVVAIVRAVIESDGAGGEVQREDTAVGPQTFRLIPRQDKVPETQTTNGVTGHPEYVLLGLPSSDVQRSDRFAWQGWEWHVSQLHLGPAYETKADLLRGRAL